jgi:hypothetical protein
LQLFGESVEINTEGAGAFYVSPSPSEIKRSNTLMERLFPNQKEVFADWFSHTIRVPQGKMLRYEHVGYSSEYEKDLIFVFENGVLVKQDVVDNRRQEELLDVVDNRKQEGLLEKIQNYFKMLFGF